MGTPRFSSSEGFAVANSDPLIDLHRITVYDLTAYFEGEFDTESCFPGCGWPQDRKYRPDLVVDQLRT